MPNRKYTKEVLQEAANASVSIAGVLRHFNLNQTGGSQAHISRCLKTFNIDTSHFTGQATNRGLNHTGGNKKKSFDEILVKRTNKRRENAYRLRRALIESGVIYECVECGISDTYNNKPLRLEVEHLNRDFTDCRKENLAFMCPNCHSQAPSNGTRLIGLTCTSEYMRHLRLRKKMAV